MNSELVSIIVPVFNQEKHLDRCVNSILRQDYPQIEVILVDDGSTDLSGGIIVKWQDSDERVHSFNKSNGGLSDARNFGIDKASGTYILFVDSDDWIDSDMVSTMLSAMEKEEADMVICGYYKNYPDGREIIENFGQPEYSVFSTEEMLKMLLCDNSITFHAWRRMYKRCLIEKDIFPRGHNYEDAFAVPILSMKCSKAVNLDVPLYHYWQNPTGISSTFTYDNKMDYLLSFEHTFVLIENKYPSLKKEVAVSRERHAMVAWDNYLVVNLGDRGKEAMIIDKIMEMIDRIPKQYINPRMRFVNYIVKRKYPKSLGRLVYRFLVMGKSLNR